MASNAVILPLMGCLNTSSDPSNCDRLIAEVNSMIVSSDLASVFVSPAIVSEALSLLKRGKETDASSTKVIDVDSEQNR